MKGVENGTMVKSLVPFVFFESWTVPKACGPLGSLESEQFKSLSLLLGNPIKSKREAKGE